MKIMITDLHIEEFLKQAHRYGNEKLMLQEFFNMEVCNHVFFFLVVKVVKVVIGSLSLGVIADCLGKR